MTILDNMVNMWTRIVDRIRCGKDEQYIVERTVNIVFRMSNVAIADKMSIEQSGYC